jgi:hypothetical protein
VDDGSQWSRPFLGRSICRLSKNSREARPCSQRWSRGSRRMDNERICFCLDNPPSVGGRVFHRSGSGVIRNAFCFDVKGGVKTKHLVPNRKRRLSIEIPAGRNYQTNPTKLRSNGLQHKRLSLKNTWVRFAIIGFILDQSIVLRTSIGSAGMSRHRGRPHGDWLRANFGLLGQQGGEFNFALTA